MRCDKPAGFAVEPEDESLLGVTEHCRVCDERYEHWVKVEGRATDDLEHLAGRRLLLQRLCQVPVACFSSLNSRVFSIAITAWSAKVWSSAICVSVNGRTWMRLVNNRANRNAFS